MRPMVSSVPPLERVSAALDADVLPVGVSVQQREQREQGEQWEQGEQGEQCTATCARKPTFDQITGLLQGPGRLASDQPSRGETPRVHAGHGPGRRMSLAHQHARSISPSNLPRAPPWTIRHRRSVCVRTRLALDRPQNKLNRDILRTPGAGVLVVEHHSLTRAGRELRLLSLGGLVQCQSADCVRKYTPKTP